MDKKTDIARRKALLEEAKNYFNLSNIEQLCVRLGASEGTASTWRARGLPDSAISKYELAKSNDIIKNTTIAEGSITLYSIDLNDLTPINFYPDVNTAAGYGAVNGDGAPEITMFPITMLKSMFGLTNFKDLDIINVVGESMEPIVHHGDTILIRRTHEARNGEIAILRIDGEIYIKRFQRDPKGKWIRLTSDNDLYRVMDFDNEEMNEIQVIGILVGKFKPY